jgi:hypothetical protein
VEKSGCAAGTAGIIDRQAKGKIYEEELKKMQMDRFTRSVISCAATALAFTLTAHATTSGQTFVSPTGNDTNPCTSAEPCLTINHALTVTSVGGEIVLSASGTYAPASITQAVNLSAPASVDASISTTAAGNAITIDTTGNVGINGITLRGHSIGTDGILVTQVGVLRLNNLTIQNFTLNGIEFQSAGGEMSLYNSSLLNNGHDGIQINAAGAHAYVEGSAFDRNGFAGGDSALGKLTISDSNAHYNDIGFYADNGSVTLFNSRAIFNTVGFKVNASGSMHFANCLLSDNVKSWDIVAGGVLSGSNPGTTLVAPGQTHTGPIGAATVLQ